MKKILKRKNKKGFTLMEMLIVVGIIAILVAIAIPTFTNANKQAKYAADQANVRAWYAEKLVDNMANGTAMPANGVVAATGDTTKNAIKLQMTGATATVEGGGSTDAKDFKVTYDPNGETGDEAKYPSITFPK